MTLTIWLEQNMDWDSSSIKILGCKIRINNHYEVSGKVSQECLKMFVYLFFHSLYRIKGSQTLGRYKAGK